MKIVHTDNIAMKMKLKPELSCLEAPGKFWKGRFKDLEEKFTEERSKMEVRFLQITTENEQLKSNLHELTSNLSTRSVSVQTSPIKSDPEAICKFCQIPLVKTRTIFPKNNDLFNENIEEKKNKSEFFIDNNLLLCKTSTSIVENRTDEAKRIDVEKTITKLFASSDHSDSEKITNKLLELYEKRSKSVPDLVYDETDYEKLLQDENKLLDEDHSDHTHSETLETSEEIRNYSEVDSAEPESNREDVKAPKHSKNKNRFLPSIRNIRKKVLGNISKMRRTCTDVKIGKDLLNTNGASNSNTSSSYITNERGTKASKKLLDTKKNEEIFEITTSSSKCQLISALKKSKSTDNIVKKVAFSDDLPSMKTVSESNLLQVVDYRESQLVGSIQVHRDRFNRPIPAPRSRKNVVIVQT